MPVWKVGNKRRLATKWQALAKKLLKRSANKYNLYNKKRKTILRNKAYRGSYKKYRR